MVSLFLKSVVFTLIVPGTVAVLIPLVIVEGIVTENAWFFLLGTFFLIGGATIYSWCVWDFVTFGRGTPAPIDAPKHLVVRGFYHYSRNPMYVGVLFVIVGWALLYTFLPILIYGLFVVTCFQIFIVFYEEPKLRKMFGRDYAGYRIKVNRWLPGLL